jgi:sulfate adenylyltransferase subunit 1 (EFTu-like GTPase family)
VKAALRRVLKPTGKKATIKQILNNDGYWFSFRPPSRGTLRIDWRTKVKRGRTLIAAARATLHKVKKIRVKVKLTAKGRKLLKHAKHVRITSSATFVSPGGKAMTLTKSFTLKR